MYSSLALFALLPSLGFAHSHSGDAVHVPYSLIKRHVQPAGNPVHKLFAKRAISYPTQDVAGPTPKAEWTDAYNTAKSAGLLTNWPVATFVANGIPTYPASANPDSPDPKGLCAWTSSTCNATDDIISVPSGMVGLSFDDGPQPPSTALLKFLKDNSLNAMHFMIGSRIVDNPDIFDTTVSNGGAIACHTWSQPDPYMTTMTDAQVLGELGWTLQIIYDRSQRLPAFWRPPYGDVDNRVRAIAKHVFGMTTVIWNQDTRDWCLADSTPGKSACAVGDGPQSSADLNAELQDFYSLSQKTGLVVLEHEHQTRAVAGFIENYPTLTAKGWKACELADCLGLPWYQNAKDDNDDPSDLGPAGIANGAGPRLAADTASNSSTTPSSSNATSSSNTASTAGSKNNSSANANTSAVASTTKTNATSSASSSAPSASQSTSASGTIHGFKAPMLSFGGLVVVAGLCALL